MTHAEQILFALFAYAAIGGVTTGVYWVGRVPCDSVWREFAIPAGLLWPLNVWRDDAGEWRCEFMRNLVTVERANFAHVAAVVQWLKEWWPSLGRRSS